MDPSAYLKALLIANDATHAMQAAVDRVREVFDCDVSWAGLLNEDFLHMGSFTGLRTPDMAATWRLGLGEGIGGRTAQLARPHKSHDYQHDARRVPMKRLIDNEGIVTVLVVPIMAADRNLGVLYAASRTPRQWQDNDVRQLESISHYLAVRLKQLDVDGKLGAEAKRQSSRAGAAIDTLRSATVLVSNLIDSKQIDSALDTTVGAAQLRLELRDKSGELLYSAGPSRNHNQKVRLTDELERGSGIYISLLSEQPSKTIGDLGLRLAYNALRLQLLRLRQREQTTEQLRGELIDQLITGRFANDKDIARRLIVIGKGNLASGARALVIGNLDIDTNVSTRFTDELRATYPHCLLEHRDARLVALVDLETSRVEQLEGQLKNLLSRQDARQKTASGHRVIGIGRFCKAPRDISMSYDEALAACEIGLSSGRRSHHEILSARSLGIQGLASMPIAQLQTTVTDTFGPLLESDRGRRTQHLSTIRSYLANDRHIPSTAAELQVHYNTVRNRIARIEKLLAIDLNNVDDRFRVESAIRMEAVLRALLLRAPAPVTTRQFQG